jgi:pyruvate,water dikinase
LFRKENNLEKSLDNILNLLDTKHYTNLSEVGQRSQSINSISTIPYEIHAKYNHQSLSKQSDIKNLGVAVRSSATTEDYHSKFCWANALSLILVVKQLIDAVHRCYVSLFTDRAIKVPP